LPDPGRIPIEDHGSTMSLECFRQLAELLSQQAVVLATVIQTRGSVPREVGSRMLIGGAGGISGTIGGGAGEARVIQRAIAVLQTGDKQRIEIDLSGAPERETQGICGGRLSVWLERWSGEEAIALAAEIVARLESGHPATLITPCAPDQSPYLLPNPGAPEPADAFIDHLQPPPTLLIVGAGHVGIQLAKVADLMDFQVVVQDDRPEWANRHHYPQAKQIFTTDIQNAIAHLEYHSQLYAALVTRGYQYDLEALKVLLIRTPPCQYIGMIGSEKRVRQVYQAIAQTGIDWRQLQTIHAPIGLDIGALTPAEIAISISAELILVRRGGSGHPLSHVLRQQLDLIENYGKPTV